MTGPAAWRRTLPAMIGALLVVCAALVIIGVSLERGGEQGHTDTGAVESSEHTETEGEHAESREQPHTEETLLGAAIESPAALVGLGVVSVALAALVWRRPTRPVAGAVIVFTIAAGVLDVVEISRQLSADRGGLAVLAMVIALLRVATLAGAAMLWRTMPARTAAPAG